MIYIPDIVPEADPADGLISRACMAKYLLGLMAEDFSQTCHLVSWAADVEYHFWSAVHGEDVEGVCGKAKLSPPERKLILDLAIVANGWWTAHPNFSDPGDSFVELDEWRARVTVYQKCFGKVS
jgi:hypothetical protein